VLYICLRWGRCLGRGEKIQDRYKELISDISRPGVGIWERKFMIDRKN
jgi:hypothetical protein